MVVVRDLPDAVAGVDRDRLRLELGHRRDALVHRRREHDRLERRARLALGLRGEVELALAGSSAHRTSPSRRRCCGSIATSAAAGPSGFRRTFSIAARAFSWRSRSIVVVTFSPPPKTRPAPYSRDELVLHVVDEVRRGPCVPGSADVVGTGQRRLVGALELALRDLALLEHHLEHVPPPQRCVARVRRPGRRATGPQGSRRAARPRRASSSFALFLKYARAACWMP